MNRSTFSLYSSGQLFGALVNLKKLNSQNEVIKDLIEAMEEEKEDRRAKYADDLTE